MAIKRLYDQYKTNVGQIYRYPATSSDNGVQSNVLTYEFTNREAIDGCINQNSSPYKTIDGTKINNSAYKLFCPITVTFGKNDVIYNGKAVYKIVSDPSDPKNTVGRNHHLRLDLELTSTDNIDIELTAP